MLNQQVTVLLSKQNGADNWLHNEVLFYRICQTTPQCKYLDCCKCFLINIWHLQCCLLGKLNSVEPGELWGMLWALYEKISVKTALCILKTLKGSLFSMKRTRYFHKNLSQYKDKLKGKYASKRSHQMAPILLLNSMLNLYWKHAKLLVWAVHTVPKRQRTYL